MITSVFLSGAFTTLIAGWMLSSPMGTTTMVINDVDVPDLTQRLGAYVLLYIGVTTILFALFASGVV